ncbi:hypothetical protein BDV95DRAFT_570619 [Massariosphaeria phaeospora]|uniref:Integral membrane protein n=1 Tax=Massariosphaeria phaeospora TaxID=100035 RepID=A0A7C8MBY0_9PLEO|nr:hypothetical protein BDV95DRAFT_570619 [Massariosphaeria phaeospora]
MQVLTPPMLIFLLVLDAYHIRNRLQERSAIPTPRSGDSPTITAYQAHQIAIESLLPHAPWMAFLIGLDPAVCLETGFAGHVLATWYYTGGLWPWTYAVKPLNLAVWRVFVFVVRSAVRIVWPCVRPLVARITHAATPFGEAVSKCYVSAVTKTARFLSPCTHPIIAPIQYLEKWIRRFEQQVDEWTLCRTARVVGDISLVVPSSILTQICLAVARGDYSCSWMCVMGFVYVLTLLPWYISRLGEVVRGRDLRAWWYAEKAGIMVVIGMGIYVFTCGY